MSWQGIEGHDRVVDFFRRSLSSGRLGSTFLFVGPAGIGKHTFAVQLAAALLCEATQPALLDPCGSCPACGQVAAGTHPDLDLIARPADRSAIPIELLIGDKQHRLREGLCARIAMRPSRGGRKVAIIDDADDLNQEGANCLLKTLEEPPPQSVLILIGTSPQRQLPTIRSRCQIVRFDPLAADTCASLIHQQAWVPDAAAAGRLAGMCKGSLSLAANWNDAELRRFRVELLASLTRTPWPGAELGKSISEFVESAGKEASVRRERLRLVIDVACDFYREVMRLSVGASGSADEELCRHAHSVVANGPDLEMIAACIERSQAARLHVDANANQNTNIDAWIDDLGQIQQHHWTTALVDW